MPEAEAERFKVRGTELGKAGHASQSLHDCKESDQLRSE